MNVAVRMGVRSGPGGGQLVGHPPLAVIGILQDASVRLVFLDDQVRGIGRPCRW